jgi:hypothetical protein
VKVPLSKLISHIVDNKSCSENNNISVNLSKNKLCSNYEVTVDLMKPNMTWRLKTFTFDGMDFVISSQKSQGRYYFMIVMLGTEVQCSEYRVELELHEYSSSSNSKKISIKFCGNPTSIDVEKAKLDSFGISDVSMKRVMDKSEDKTSSFSVSYTISKEK